MAGKVFHVDDDTHYLVDEYCREKKLQRKEWVTQVLRAAIAAGAVPEDVPKVPEPKKAPKKEPRTIVVQKRGPVQILDDEPTNPPPWALPPFWARK